ncbi:MAG: hypothetical protein ACPG47_01180 [Leucothrix sp.]
MAKIYCRKHALKALKLGKNGVYKTLYAAFKQIDTDTPYIHHFLELGKQKRL